MGKKWDAAALPSGAIGYGAPYNATPGDLYAVFPDGTYQLLEKGFGARQTEEAAAANKIADAKYYADLAKSGSVAPVPATPTTVVSSPTSTSQSEVKASERDSILFDDETVSIAVMENLVFENLGGHELLNISRRDTINGQKVIYQPIKNLSEIEQKNNPINIINLPSTLDKFFANFPIKLDTKIPEAGSGPNGEYLYINRSTGDLTIDVINLESGEQVEIQIAAGGTIYEAEI
jgi:hypothetical protein